MYIYIYIYIHISVCIYIPPKQVEAMLLGPLGSCAVLKCRRSTDSSTPSTTPTRGMFSPRTPMRRPSGLGTRWPTVGNTVGMSALCSVHKLCRRGKALSTPSTTPTRGTFSLDPLLRDVMSLQTLIQSLLCDKNTHPEPSVRCSHSTRASYAISTLRRPARPPREASFQTLGEGCLNK